MNNCYNCRFEDGGGKARCAYCASVYDDTGQYSEWKPKVVAWTNYEDLTAHLRECAKYESGGNTFSSAADAIEELTERTNLMCRAWELLSATYKLLYKQDQSPYVLNILATTVFYDGAECDGSCLMDDIEAIFEEADIQMSDFTERT